MLQSGLILGEDVVQFGKGGSRIDIYADRPADLGDKRGGHVYCGDVAGNLIYHSNGDREAVLSSWNTTNGSTTPVLILYQNVLNGSQGDLLTTNLSILSSITTLTLPFGTGGVWAYDGALAYDAANSRYLMAYTVSNLAGSTALTEFYPALAYASSPTGTWTSIGIDNTLAGNWEGTSFDNVAGALYELAGGPRTPFITSMPACSAARIYDETFAYRGNFLGSTFLNSDAPSAVNCSHSTLLQHPDMQHYGILTFNGTEFGGNANNTGQPIVEISTP